MSYKVKSARFFKATGPRPLFRAMQNGGYAGLWVLGQGLVIRKALQKRVARLAASHRERLENFVENEWSVLAVDLRLDGESPVAFYLETVTKDGPLRIKVGACDSPSIGRNGEMLYFWTHALIYVTDKDGLSDEILARGALDHGAFYEYVRDSWATGDFVATWGRYRERILKDDPTHYCLD